MALNPLILTGNLKIGTSSGTAVDVSDYVTAFKISAKRDIVAIPATFGSDKSSRAGSVEYELTIDYFSNDDSTTGLFGMLWAAMVDVDGDLYFEGTFRDGSVSSTNPEWSGTFIVTGAAVGGTVAELSQDSQTFPMTGAPTRATT